MKSALQLEAELAREASALLALNEQRDALERSHAQRQKNITELQELLAEASLAELPGASLPTSHSLTLATLPRFELVYVLSFLGSTHCVGPLWERWGT